MEMNSELKKCLKCEKELPSYCFTKDKDFCNLCIGEHGRACKEIKQRINDLKLTKNELEIKLKDRENSRIKRQKSPKSANKKSKMYYRRNKLELVRFMGNKCQRCGLSLSDFNNCLAVFEIDELEPLDNIDSKTKFKNLSKSRLELAKQLFLEGKIQLLCANCHRMKNWETEDL